MPIYPAFDNAVFGPTQTKLMADAFEHSIRLFKITPPKMAREAMANRIIEAAHQGARDVDQLVDAALVGTSLTRQAASVGSPVIPNRALETAVELAGLHRAFSGSGVGVPFVTRLLAKAVASPAEQSCSIRRRSRYMSNSA
jgi:hypothetical protein